MTPHKCPVCGGRGYVGKDFYGIDDSTGSSEKQCRSCSGSGIIHSPGISTNPDVKYPWGYPDEYLFSPPEWCKRSFKKES